MSATINVHGPYTYEPHHYDADPVDGTREYVSLWARVPGALLHLYYYTRAELDDLIQGARDARDLLPEDAPGGAS